MLFFWTKKAKVSRALEKMNSRDPETRCKGAEILERLGPTLLQGLPASQPVLDVLIAHTQDPNQYARVRSLMAIESIRATGPSVLSALQASLTDNYPFARSAAASALKTFGPEGAKAVPSLLKAFALERHKLAKMTIHEAIEALAPNFRPSGEEVADLVPPIEAAAGALARSGLDLSIRFTFRFWIQLLGKVGSPASIALTRLALLCTTHDSYLEHEWVLKELEEVGLAGPEKVIDLLNWVDKEQEAWRKSWHNKNQADKAATTAKNVISRFGREAVERFLSKYSDTHPIAKAEALEALKRLRKFLHQYSDTHPQDSKGVTIAKELLRKF